MKKFILIFSSFLTLTLTFAQAPSYVPTNGLVGWWPFNGNATDESGNGNNGVVNGAILTTDRFNANNSAYNLPNLNDYIDVINPSPIYNGNAITISFWMKFPLQYNYSTIFLVKNGIPYTNGFSISIDQNDAAYGPNNYQVNFLIGSTSCSFTTNQNELGTWANISGVYDGNSINLYLNNVLKSTVNYSSNIISSDGNLLFADWDNPSPPSTSDRNLDDIGIWNRALTPQEIQNLFNSCSLTINPFVDDTLSICGSGDTLNAGSGFTSYLWNTGDVTQKIYANQSGKYTVTVTDANGCTASDEILVSIVEPQIFPSDATICEGDAISLMAFSNIATPCVSPLPASLQNGLVAFYPFCGNANDISSNGYHGTATNVTQTYDRYGYPNSAYQFNGTNSEIFINHTMFNPGWTNMTINGWISLNGVSNSNNINFAHTLFNTSGPNGMKMSINSGNSGKYHLSVGSGTPASSFDVLNAVSDTIANDLYWTNFTLMKSADTFKLYIGDVLDTMWISTTPIQSYLYKLYLGRTDPSLPAEVFKGTMDDIGIWNRKLSIQEIKQLYMYDFTTFDWSTGDTTSSIDVSPATSTVYSVIVSNGVTSCTVTSSITVSIPTATITPSGPTTFCAGDSVILYANNAPNNTYQWQLNGNNINGANDSVFVADATGNYSVIVTNANGCTETSTATSVTVNPLPNATVTASGTTTFCDGNSVVLTAEPGLNYLWTNSLTTQSITVSQSGTYKVTVTDANSCSSTSLATVVTVNPNPVASVTTIGNTVFCQGGSVTLEGPPNLNYAWSNSETTQNTIITQTGNYTLIVTDANNCSDTSTAITVTVNANPVATITPSGPTTFCSGNTVSFQSSSGASYYWSTGETTQNISVGLSDTIWVIVTDFNNCSDTSSVSYVVVNPLPNATITPSGPLSFCTGGNVTLDAQSGLSYQWSTGSIASSITVSSSGNYVVTVTDANNCVNTSTATTVTVNSLPVVSITPIGNTTFCDGNNVTLQASAGVSYLWNTTETSANIIVTQSGNYTVTVTDANNCSSSSAPVTITVNSLPLATISPSGPLAICDGSDITLTASPAVSYLWSTGATTSGILVNQSGNYSVVVTDANNCSSTSAVSTVSINTLPNATVTASGPTTFCSGNNVVLNAPTGLSYLWNTGDNTPSITVSASGNYTVTVTDANNCTNTSTPTTIVVNSLPIASITPLGNTTFCDGNNVTLEASAGVSYLWNTTETSANIIVTQSGNYTVTVTDANNCSSSSAPISITVNSLPTATITPSGPTTFCSGNDVILTASNAVAYLWSSGETTPGILVNQSGNYTVVVTDVNNCSSTSAVTTVTINIPNPATINPSGPVNLCTGNTLTLQASTGNSYLWSTGETTPTIDVTQGGSYTVVITDANGCISTSSATTVTLIPSPTVNITPSGPTTFCSGGNFTLTASPGASHIWNTGATIPTINITQSGTYTVTVSNYQGCTTSASIAVTVLQSPAPVVTTSGSTTFCSGGNVTLQAPSGLSYLWSSGQTTQNISVNQSGSYTVVVTGANNCTAASVPIQVTVNNLPDATISASGNTTFCNGNSVNLSVPASGSYLWSNGSTTQNINVTQSGAYSVVVTSADNCTATSTITNVTVNPSPVAIITASGNTTFCEGDTLTLNAAGGTSYAWSTNSTNASIDVTQGGTYSVIVTDANNCSSTATIITSVNPAPVATITPNGNVTVCQGGSVSLTASTGITHIWSNGITLPTINVSQSGSYVVTVTDGNNCSSTSQPVIVSIIPSYQITDSVTACGSYTWPVNNTTYNLSGSYSSTLTASTGCDSVITLLLTMTVAFNEEQYITICEGNTFTVGNNTYDASGIYTDVLTSVNGCDSIVTTVLTVTNCTGITPNEKINVNLYPNPAIDFVTLEIDEILIGKSFNMFDQSGRLMLSGTLISTKQLMDVSMLAKGMYYIRMEGIENSLKLIKY